MGIYDDLFEIDRILKEAESEETCMNIRPLHDRMVVRAIETQAKKTNSGLFIPESAQEKPNEGEVLAIGKGKRLPSGELIPLDVKVGDRILYGKYSGSDIEVSGQKLLIMREEDVFGVIELGPVVVIEPILDPTAEMSGTAGA